MSSGKGKTKTKSKLKKDGSSKFKRLRALKCYEEVNEMLYAGYPIAAVADFIQHRMKEYQDVTRLSMIEILKRYRRHLKDGGYVHATLPRAFQDAHKGFSKKMSELERLEEQFWAMRYRFDVAHAKERLHGRIDPEVDRINKSMVTVISKMHDIKMDLGLIGSRDLGTVTVSAERVEYVREKYGDKAAQAFADPVSRGRVLAALSALRRAGGPEKEDEDGEGIRVSPVADKNNDNVVDAEVVEPVDSSVEAGEEINGGVRNPDMEVPWSLNEDGYDEKVEAVMPEMIVVDDDGGPGAEENSTNGDASQVEQRLPMNQSTGNLPPGPEKAGVRSKGAKRWVTRVKKG